MKKNIFFTLILSLVSYEAFCMNSYEEMNFNCKNKRTIAKMKKRVGTLNLSDNNFIGKLDFGDLPHNSPVESNKKFNEPSDEIYKDNLNKTLAYYIVMYINAIRAYGDITKSHCESMAEARGQSEDPEDVNWYKNHIEGYRQLIIKYLETEGVDVNKAAKLPKNLEPFVEDNSSQFPLERVIRLRGPIPLIKLLMKYDAKECGYDSSEL